jgi:hypothetical protein
MEIQFEYLIDERIRRADTRRSLVEIARQHRSFHANFPYRTSPDVSPTEFIEGIAVWPSLSEAVTSGE